MNNSSITLPAGRTKRILPTGTAGKPTGNTANSRILYSKTIIIKEEALLIKVSLFNYVNALRSSYCFFSAGALPPARISCISVLFIE